MNQILDKYDLYMAKDDFANAERLLLYWKGSFACCKNLISVYKILNELVGFYRKTNRKEEGKKVINELLDVIKTLKIEEEGSSVTAYINIATALSAFNEQEKSYEYFKKAEKLLNEKSPYDRYNGNLKKTYASLYNNMAVTLMNIGEYNKALLYDEKAIEINSTNPKMHLDSANTYCNMANVIEVRDRLDNKNGKPDEDTENKINQYLNKAKEIFNDENIERDSYYAFVCSKCAPVFDYYGHFMYAEELLRRKREIDEGLRDM